jgi:hypothetical protein
VYWLLRAWPILALLVLSAIHISALRSLPANTVLVNKVAGTVMQIVGGLIVLFAVDSNLGLFNRQTLAAAVVAWVSDFPLRRRAVTIQLNGVAAATATGSATLTVGRAATTIEEKLAELDRQLNELKSMVRQQNAAVHAKLEAVKAELSGAVESNRGALADLSARIETATVGGFKQQAFGVLLAIYGAVVSVFA